MKRSEKTGRRKIELDQLSSILQEDGEAEENAAAQGCHAHGGAGSEDAGGGTTLAVPRGGAGRGGCVGASWGVCARGGSAGGGHGRDGGVAKVWALGAAGMVLTVVISSATEPRG